MSELFDIADELLKDVILPVRGDSFTHYPAAGPSQILLGIPEDPHTVESNLSPQFAVRYARYADFATAPAKGDTVMIGTTLYNIFDVLKKEIEPGIHLILSKA